MKVKVEVVLDVDAKAWAEEFMLDRYLDSEVRADVKKYMAVLCEDQLERLQLKAAG
jgi:hypothetical protein